MKFFYEKTTYPGNTKEIRAKIRQSQKYRL